ncbi:MAG: hypothetical protein EBT14_07655 [Betaproteobacteria bacterium]|nr:hypothetical protein [Betaproteobacteria bacterium]
MDGLLEINKLKRHGVLGSSNAKEIGMSLTENLAMLPASAVSGFYFWRPESQYFNLGPIGQDQLHDYMARTGLSKDQASSRLASLL